MKLEKKIQVPFFSFLFSYFNLVYRQCHSCHKVNNISNTFQAVNFKLRTYLDLQISTCTYFCDYVSVLIISIMVSIHFISYLKISSNYKKGHFGLINCLNV